MGIFSKFAAALVAIPGAVLGGMTTFLFSAVAISGIRIISTVPFTRRTRFILTAAMSVGFGATLVPNWFTFVFTYAGDNRALRGFFDAIVLVMETGFAVTAFVAIILNLLIPEEDAEEEAESLAGDLVDREIELGLEGTETETAVHKKSGEEVHTVSGGSTEAKTVSEV
jgi:xanthine/uracil permease